MRASQRLQERCDWVRIVNKLDIEISTIGSGFTDAAQRRLADIRAEREAAVEELAKLGYVVRDGRR